MNALNPSSACWNCPAWNACSAVLNCSRGASSIATPEPTIVGPVATAAAARRLAEIERRPGRRRGRRTSGALGAVVPSGCGAPGAFGAAFGIEGVRPPRLRRRGASSITATGGAAAAAGAGAGRRRGRRRAGSFAEAEFDVLAELLELVLEPMLGVLQLLDAAVRLPQRLLEPVDAQDERRRLIVVAAGLARNVGGRRCAAAAAGGGRDRSPAARAGETSAAKPDDAAVRRRIRTTDQAAAAFACDCIARGPYAPRMAASSPPSDFNSPARRSVR